MGKKAEILFIKKEDELVWLDLTIQMIVELCYQGVGSTSRIIIYIQGNY
jgi:hypothetical protein